MKNTLADLNNYLFEAIERINDDDASEEQLEKELKKAKATCDVGRAIIDNANLVYKARVSAIEYGVKEDLLIGTKI